MLATMVLRSPLGRRRGMIVSEMRAIPAQRDGHHRAADRLDGYAALSPQCAYPGVGERLLRTASSAFVSRFRYGLPTDSI